MTDKEKGLYDYILHIGDGNFVVVFSDESTLNVGPSLNGMIRYTYFENYAIPPVNWAVKREQLMKDHNDKFFIDVQRKKFICEEGVWKLNPDFKEEIFI